MIITEKHIHILDEAEKLFARNGYDGTTVRDIAQAAEVNLAMISYYFGSKEKLIEMLFQERMGSIRLRIEAVVNNTGIGPFQKLEILIDQYIERVFNKQDFYKVLFTEQVLQKNEMILHAVQEYKLEFIALIDEVIAEGTKKRLFKKNVDTMLLLTTMTGTVMQMLINKQQYKQHNKYEHLDDHAFEGIIKPKLSTHIKGLFKSTLAYEQK
jgi:AcrR family transcriptional regulator